MRTDYNLTKMEQEILSHRLEVSDCIAEALEMEFYTPEIDDICRNLNDQVKEGSLPLKLTGVAAQVLSDAVCGSTMYALTSEEYECGAMDFVTYKRYCKAGRRLAKLVTIITGIETTYPDY